MAKLRHLVYATLIGAVLVISGCSSDKANDAAVEKTGLSADEINSEAFKDLFPLQYESYAKTSQTDEDTKYGGSIKRSKFDEDKEPLLPILFNGYGFALDYNEDRGHFYANEDVMDTLRVNEKTIGSCLTCKSTAVPHLIEEMGDDYWGASLLDEIWPKAEEMGHSAIGCSDCHDPETMDLRVTRPSFIKAQESRGVDMSNPTKNDMRTYVCGQCHVEYYFADANGEVTYPWSEGLKPTDMYDYYSGFAKENNFEQDWIHNISGTKMLKAQHSEFETFSEGPHGKADVSCADCHMPYERIDGKKKITSHWITSPLKTMDQSCATCHSNRELDELESRVGEIQDTHVAALHKAQDISVKAHYYINKMITTGVDKAKIEQAQEHVRKGQWFWDIVAAENSAGFHNPQGAMDSLKKSSEESNAAIQLATVELTKAGVDINEVDKEIEKVKKAVQEEKDDTKKRDHATNSYFPAQQPK